MDEPILASTETCFSYCAICKEPARVGALQIKGWKHTPFVCAGCLRNLATTIELEGASPTAARVAESTHE